MKYELMVTFDAETPEEANSIACDVEQVLSGRDIVEFLNGQTVFPHTVSVSRATAVDVVAAGILERYESLVSAAQALEGYQSPEGFGTAYLRRQPDAIDVAHPFSDPTDQDFVIRTAAFLLGDDAATVNPEYTRAILELCSDLLGYREEDREILNGLIRERRDG